MHASVPISTSSKIIIFLLIFKTELHMLSSILGVQGKVVTMLSYHHAIRN
jgi:hypothetical protein